MHIIPLSIHTTEKAMEAVKDTMYSIGWELIGVVKDKENKIIKYQFNEINNNEKR